MHCPKNNEETKILIFFKTFRYVLNSNNSIYIGLGISFELPIHNSLKTIYEKAFIDFEKNAKYLLTTTDINIVQIAYLKSTSTHFCFLQTLKTRIKTDTETLETDIFT